MASSGPTVAPAHPTLGCSGQALPSRHSRAWERCSTRRGPRMFERLSDGFSTVFRKLSGKGSISESNITEALADVRNALLEADVEVDVANDFIESVKADAVGREVTKSLQPG